MLNSEIQLHFAQLQAHSDVVSELRAATKRLGECELTGGGPSWSAVCGVTTGTIFCAAADLDRTFWRLRPEDVAIALATGARATELGPEWVEILLFQPHWPKPDLQHWALRAYDYARSGS